MTSLPAVVETTPVSDDLATDVIVDRFLTRVAALTPAQWGTLDAIGQRFQGGDPIARWTRMRRLLAAFDDVPALRDVLTAVGVVGGLALGAVASVERALAAGTRDRAARRHTWRRLADRAASEATRRRAMESAESPLGARVRWERERLVAIAVAQPRGPGAAMPCLMLALTALRLRRALTPRAFSEMYELVDGVIPSGSIGATA